MDKAAVIEILKQFKVILEKKGIKINKLILYGSYATGRYREGSDIDVAIISDDFEDKDYWERIDILSEAIYEIFQPIEAVAFTPTEWNRRESMIIDFAEKGETV